MKDAAPGSRKRITKTAALKQAKTELRELKQQNKQAKLHAAEEQNKLKSYISDTLGFLKLCLTSESEVKQSLRKPNVSELRN